MIKLKNLIKEAYVWERKFGEKLPTLADVQKKKLTEAKKHGFDLTDFKNGGFQKVLKGLKIRPKAKLTKSKHGADQWEWKGNGILIVTGNNPITGEYASSASGKSPIKRKNEKDYASYMGIEGKPELVQQAVELVHKWASYIKNESPGTRSYI